MYTSDLRHAGRLMLKWTAVAVSNGNGNGQEYLFVVPGTGSNIWSLLKWLCSTTNASFHAVSCIGTACGSRHVPHTLCCCCRLNKCCTLLLLLLLLLLLQIDIEVDNDPRCAFFRQAGNGLFIRMAVVKQCLLG